MTGDVIRFDRSKGNQSLEAYSVMDEREDAYLVGRSAERERFGRYLNGDAEMKPVWSLYGIGGVGKSTLLDAFRRQARRHGAVYVLLDSREFARNGEAFCRRLMEQLPPPAARMQPHDRPVDHVLEQLARLSRERRVVVALDTFEEIGMLEGWLRDEFVRRLPPEVLVILAGRYPLKGSWLVSPAWRERTEWIPLGHLERTDVMDYARRCGLTEPEQGQQLWEFTHGHGLSLALAVSSELLGGGGPLDHTGWSGELASLWLKEVPDEELRTLVEAASMLRLFNQELLESVIGAEISAQSFTRLAQLSFVRKSDRGWRLHDLMRDSIRIHLRERSPARFGKLMSRCVLYYATAIRESYRKRDVSAEVGELFHYIGDERVRAFLNGPAHGGYTWETLSAANLEEGQQYLERRRREAAPVTRRGVDPVTGELLVQSLTQEEILYMIAGVDLEELLALGQQTVMLMKSEEGSVCGLAAIIPIHSGTFGYLEQNAFSGPYIRSLTPAERKALEVPGPEPSGWFIRSIDVLDWNDTAQLLESVSQMYAYMCAGKLFFATPPPLELHRLSHLGLGFEIVPDVVHCSYDGITPTPTFVLDTRGEKLEAFLATMLGRVGVELEAMARGSEPQGKNEGEPEYPFERYGLTEREREVVRLVIEGCSNAEIAARLFVSEITVKKHLSSVYTKVQAKNRSQLIKAMLQS